MYDSYDERGPRRSYAPVKEGDEFDVTIEAVGEKGDGLAKKDGFVLFVPNTKQGDQVRVKVTRVLRKVGFAEVVGKAKGESKSESEEEGEYGKEGEESPKEGDEDADYEDTEDTEDSENFGED